MPEPSSASCRLVGSPAGEPCSRPCRSWLPPCGSQARAWGQHASAVRRRAPSLEHSPTRPDRERCGSFSVPSASAWREWGGIVESVRLLVSLLGGQGSVLLPVSGTVPRGGPRPLARSGRFEGSYTDMTERIIVPDAALDELEASRSFEAFYEAEARILFRRLWLVTGNRAEAEELMQDAFLKVWERWDRVGGMDDPLAYLYRTAMNLFRKRYRRAMLAVRRTVGLAPSNDDFSDAEDRQGVPPGPPVP